MKQTEFIRNDFYKNIVYGLLLFTCLFIVFFIIQFAYPNLSGRDAYYHIRYAEWIRHHGIYNFKWLPYSILRPETYTDHHLLYHILLIPFTFYSNLVIGIKISIVFFQTILFMVFFHVLKKYRIPYPLIWLFMLFSVSPAFLYRISQGRVQTVSLTFIVVISYLILKHNKTWLLCILSFLYVWLVDAYTYAAVFLLFYYLSSLLTGVKQDKKVYIAVLGGILLGHLLNPYFPKNIFYEIKHYASKINVAKGVPVGNEWYPFKSTYYFFGQGLLYIMILLGLTSFIVTQPKSSTDRRNILYYFFATVLMMALYAKSRRFIEYFPPFALIFSGLCSRELNFFQKKLTPVWKIIFIIVVIAGILPFTYKTYKDHISDLKDNFHYARKAGCAVWMRENLPDNVIVFTTDWDDFPELMFYNTKQRYAEGLDPYYLYYYDKKLYDLWDDISDGDIKKPSKILREKFKAAAVFTVRDKKKFIKKAEKDPGLKRTYKDKHCRVYMTKNE